MGKLLLRSSSQKKRSHPRIIYFGKCSEHGLRRRGKKQKAKAIRKYYRQGRHGKWTFATTDGLTLWKHADVKIKRHTLIKPDKSPYDGDWVYWSTRRGKDIETPTRVAKTAEKAER
jgi:RNA-directed DNA polymerase